MKPNALSLLVSSRTSVGADVLTEILYRAVADLAVREEGGMPADGRSDEEAAAGATALLGAVLALWKAGDVPEWRVGEQARDAFLTAAEVAYDSAADEVGRGLGWPAWMPDVQTVFPRDLLVNVGRVYGWARGWANARLAAAAAEQRYRDAVDAAHGQ